jgi:molybdate transport system ATP-binding protein
VPLDIALAFTLRQGEFLLTIDQRIGSDAIALVGPSGAGKTTLLETIAGLRRPLGGEIAVGGRTLFSSVRGIDVPARQRHIGYVPQDTLLFPHMDVRRNILYGAGHAPRLDLGDVLEMLEIGHLVTRMIDRLSGGERQRVALARALMASPTLLLLDEPFSALDPLLRWRVVPCLQRIRRDLGLPMLVASHDLDLVATIADTAVELSVGRVSSVRLVRPDTQQQRRM